MRGLGPRLLLAALLAVAWLTQTSVGLAQPSAPAEGVEQDKWAPEAKTLEILVEPVFGAPSIPQGGWTEVLVRITNRGKAPVAGKVTVSAGTTPMRVSARGSLAPFSVGVGATVRLHLPVRVGEYYEPLVRVLNGAGKTIVEQPLRRAHVNGTLLVDVAKASALGAALRSIPVGSRNDPWAVEFRGYPTSAGPTTVEVASPSYDPVTGDPVLPRRAAGYSRAAAVLLRSDELCRLGAAELEALSGYVMGGGTLAVVITRPEDLRHPTVVALVGGEAQTATVGLVTLKELILSVPPSHISPSTPPSLKAQPRRTDPEPAVSEQLTGYSGGNLAHSPYGSSAPYGLGEVHLLGFDPQAQPAVDSVWVHVRMIDLLRRANERLSGVLFRHGAPHSMAGNIRRQLDPNESARWAIVVAALLLCIYAIFAAPVNFTYFRKKHRPLRALIALPILSAATFAAVVATGVAAKGCSGRSRHLTVVEMGGGMKTGTARRWRGFFVPNARDITVRAGSASSVLGTEMMDYDDETKDQVVVDREALRLVDLQLRPWETLVVREDGYVTLGDGIALVRKGPGETLVVNRTGHRLRGLVLNQPGLGGLYLESLDDGASASSKTFATLAAAVVPRTAPTAAGLPVSDFNAYGIGTELDDASQGLSSAWQAVVDTLMMPRDWFPMGVPTLLCQVDGGEGGKRDSGLTLDSDRLLVRVVGYGGAP